MGKILDLVQINIRGGGGKLLAIIHVGGSIILIFLKIYFFIQQALIGSFCSICITM